MTTVPDLLRLVAVPVLGWAAYRDIEIRRVPNETWYPLLAIALVVLAWDGLSAYRTGAFAFRAFWIRASLSIGLLVPMGYAFWWVGGIGGADAKAMFVLALLYPTYPTYLLEVGNQVIIFPLTITDVGVFSLTVLTNTVILGATFPLALGVRNLARGELTWRAFVATKRPWHELEDRHGRLMQTADGDPERGMDIDALRMYCRWRRTDLATLREERDRLRDPETIPEDRGDPTDGAVDPDPGTLLADGGEAPGGEADESSGDGAGSSGEGTESPDDAADPDPWGAEAFFADLEGSAYGTTPGTLRDGLEVVTTADEVWYTPGLPFIVPMFAGLVVGLVYGDLLFGLLRAIAGV